MRMTPGQRTLLARVVLERTLAVDGKRAGPVETLRRNKLIAVKIKKIGIKGRNRLFIITPTKAGDEFARAHGASKPLAR